MDGDYGINIGAIINNVTWYNDAMLIDRWLTNHDIDVYDDMIEHSSLIINMIDHYY